MKTINQNFYCSQKFTWLSVDLEKKLTYSCCSAHPDKIDTDWVTSNPGQLFNTEKLQYERQRMLENLPVDSCRDACWIPESKGLASRRLTMKSYIPINKTINTATPASLNIVLGSTCNLTCSYCCKQYSSAWRRDIELNGAYLDQDRFNITPTDKFLLKLSHAEIQGSAHYQLLVDQLKLFGPLESVHITGGEPFLYKNLIDLLNELTDTGMITIQTGLGVDSKRFSSQLDLIKNHSNVQICISAEGLDKFYEFNRYGNSYTNFLKNIGILESRGFKIQFSSVISNLTIVGLLDFAEKFAGHATTYHYCNDPDFLSVNVLDDDSKATLIGQLDNSNLPIKTELISTIQRPSSEKQRTDLATYLSKFASNRNLKLDIFPESLLKWMNESQGDINVV